MRSRGSNDEKGIGKDLPIRDWKPRSDRDFSLFAWAATGADLFGFDGVGEAFRRAAAGADAAQLDGLLAVWHPSRKMKQRQTYSRYMIKSELVLKSPSRTRICISATSRTSSTRFSTRSPMRLPRGDRVELRGFGAFSVKKRDARTGRNPRTGESVSSRRKGRAGVQDRQGNATAAQRAARRS